MSLGRLPLAFLFLLAAGPATAQRPCDTLDSLGPSRDLYCMELIAAPGIDGISGRVELAQPPSPFTVAVTADGRPRSQPIIALAGLPAPSSFGRFRSYLAWAATPAMHPVINLGEVRNGRTTLPVIDLEKFILLVTAEWSTSVKEPSGRVLLRAQSPSTRLFPPDLQQFMLGSVPPGEMPAGRAGMAGHGEHTMAMGDSASARWTTVPMPANLTMLPGEMVLRPDLAAYLPTGDAPAARPREIVRLQNGDTLSLDAGLVRRNLLGREYTMFAFNGQYPGPLIEVARGAEITVAFSNHLPQPSSVHWHGIRLDNGTTGCPVSPSPPSPPAGRSSIGFASPTPGSTGTTLTSAKTSSRSSVSTATFSSGHRGTTAPANREVVLMLDDLLVGDDGLVPLGADAPTHALMGRFGNVMLVNGEPAYRLTSGAARWCGSSSPMSRTPVASTSLSGGARMKVVGGDVRPVRPGDVGRERGASRRRSGTWWTSASTAGTSGDGQPGPGNRPSLRQVLAERDTLGVVTVGAAREKHDLTRSFAALGPTWLGPPRWRASAGADTAPENARPRARGDDLPRSLGA